MSLLQGGENGTLEYHEVVVKSCAAGQSSKGTPCIEIDFGNESGSIRSYHYLSPAALKYTVKMLGEVFGWNAEERGNNFEELCGDGSVLIGKPAQVAIQMEEYEGNLNAKVAFVNKTGGGRAQLDPADVASIFDSVRAENKLSKRAVVGNDPERIKAAAGEGAAKAKAKAKAKADDINIPFALFFAVSMALGMAC